MFLPLRPTLPGLASRALQCSSASEGCFLGSISSQCRWHRLGLHLGIHTIEGGWCIPRKESAGKESIRTECQDSTSVGHTCICRSPHPCLTALPFMGSSITLVFWNETLLVMLFFSSPYACKYVHMEVYLTFL